MAYIQSTGGETFSLTTSHTFTLTGVTAGSFLVVSTRTTSSEEDVTGVSSSVDGALTSLRATTNGSIDLKDVLSGERDRWQPHDHGHDVWNVGHGSLGHCRVRFCSRVAVVDVETGAAFTTTTTPTTANITTTGTTRTVISIVALNAYPTSIAPASGETERIEVNTAGSNLRVQLQDEAAATAGSYSASWTLGATQPGIYQILAIKPSTTKYLKLLAYSSAASAADIEGVVLNELVTL